jgi:transposase
MAGFIEGVDRGQSVLFPDRLDDRIREDSLVRIVDIFVEELDLQHLGFARSAPARTGRPGYRPAVLLKLFICGYLNRIPSSRRLEREAGRNIEVMWLTGKIEPYAYLRDLFTNLANGHLAQDIDTLMPWAYAQRAKDS